MIKKTEIKISLLLKYVYYDDFEYFKSVFSPVNCVFLLSSIKADYSMFNSWDVNIGSLLIKFQSALLTRPPLIIRRGLTRRESMNYSNITCSLQVINQQSYQCQSETLNIHNISKLFSILNIHDTNYVLQLVIRTSAWAL